MGGQGSSMRARLRRLLTAALLAVAVASVTVATAGGEDAPAERVAAAKKCKRALVDGRTKCLRVGDRCKKRFQDDYVSAGYSCRKGRLRKAGIQELRGSQPLLLKGNGQVPLKTALAAFDETIAPLPGVKAKKGEIGEIGDATMVVDAIEANIGQLSPQQRRVFEQWTTPAADAILIDPANPRPAPADGRRAPATAQELTSARSYVDQALNVLRGHGFFPSRPISLSLLQNQGTSPKALAYVTLADLAPGTSPTCNMFLTQKGRNLSEIDKQFTLSHEAAHCVQHAFYSNRADAARVPSWVKEGTAEYLGAKVIEELGAGTPTQVDWTGWLKDPDHDLFKRSYDAIGFYAMLAQAGVDTYARIKSVISAAVGGGSQPAYAAAIAGAPDTFFSRWGPGLHRDPALGPEWDYTGPFIDPSRVKKVTIANGQKRVSTLKAHSSAAAQLELRADVITIKTDKDARGLLRFEGEQRKLAKGAYCAKQGGCKCRTQTNLQIPKIGRTTYFGWSSPDKARTTTIEGRSLRDYCKKPSPSPAQCTARPGRRGEAASCPVPGPGIQVFQGTEPGNEQLVATFRIADCTADQGFTAISTDGAWRLEIGIQNFTGFGRDYDIPYGGPDPQVVLDGPGGPYSNTTWAPPGLSFAGSIVFDETGRNLGAGWIEFRNAEQSSAVAGAGGMTCVYPDD